jgi:hypothetical protein
MRAIGYQTRVGSILPKRTIELLSKITDQQPIKRVKRATSLYCKKDNHSGCKNQNSRIYNPYGTDHKCECFCHTVVDLDPNL